MNPTPHTPESRDGDYGVMGLHDTNLHDVNESSAGDRIDPSTGDLYDNSTYTDRQQLLATGGFVVEASTQPYTDVLPPIFEEDDAAAKFLRAHSS